MAGTPPWDAGYTYLQIKVIQRDHTTATLHGRLRQCARRRRGLEASAGIVQSAFSGHNKLRGFVLCADIFIH